MSGSPAWLWGLLAGLLSLSAFFSSSETALFSLSRRERARSSAAVRRLLADPRALLSSVLLCNLVVNLLFFAFAGRLAPDGGAWTNVGVALVSLVAVVVGGEILPKTIGLRLRSRMARLAAPPLLLVVELLGPLAGPIARLLEAADRRLLPFVRDEKPITPDVLAGVLERGAQEGLLLDMEADLLAEVIELEGIRVREIMTPRVDALFLDISDADRDAKLQEALRRGQSWLPVVDGSPDQVLGRVRVRDLLLHPERPARMLVMPVKFVPEVISALDLLKGLREDRTAEAVVVDEWGGTAGCVTAEDVFEEIVGDLRAEGEARVPAAVPLGEGRYRIAGSLTIRDWNERFGLAIVPTEFETVGGFVTAQLGRLPRAGDVVRAENLVLEVHEVRGRRILTVDIRVDEPQAARSGP